MADAWRAEMGALADALTQAGQPPLPLTFGDGSRLLVLPSSGRVVGLFPPESDANFLWTNPALAAGESAAAYFAREGWPNPGGDRTWLAPEIELFIADLERPGETYATPPTLDPGSWALTSADASALSLTNETRLRLHRSRRDVGVRLGKSLHPAGNPLDGTLLADAGMQYAGYTQVTTLEVEPQPGAEVRLGLWNLLQLPPPGVMLIPTRERVQPQQVFGALSPEELTLGSRLVRWEMGGPGVDAKIALRAPGLVGRAGHLSEGPRAGEADLVVREFAVDPGGEYVDALWDPPHETGWVFQACCVRAGAERFNELEYHAPVVTGASISRDESRLWAFRGPSAAIRAAAELLLTH
jgi:hypothetical protein